MPPARTVKRDPVAQAVLDVRLASGRTQIDFAELMQVSLATLGRFERDCKPSYAFLERILPLARNQGMNTQLEILERLMSSQVRPLPKLRAFIDVALALGELHLIADELVDAMPDPFDDKRMKPFFNAFMRLKMAARCLGGEISDAKFLEKTLQSAKDSTFGLTIKPQNPT
jgi:transcriptional regulator with XRE-family HTH domain